MGGVLCSRYYWNASASGSNNRTIVSSDCRREEKVGNDQTVVRASRVVRWKEQKDRSRSFEEQLTLCN